MAGTTRRSGERTAGGSRTEVAPRRRVATRLPTRRAFTGAALVALAAAGVIVAHRSASSPPAQRYVVAAAHVPAGRVVTAGDLGTVAIDLPDGVVAVRSEEADALVGRVARVGLEPLALVRSDDLLEPGRFLEPGSVEVVLDLAPARALSGTVRSGDRVDVLATHRDDDGTHAVASGALVSWVDSGSDERIGSSASVRVRLSLPDAEVAAAVVDASLRAEVSLVLPAPTPEAST